MADIKSAALIRDDLIGLMNRHAAMLNELASTAGNRDDDWHTRNGQAANNAVTDLMKLTGDLLMTLQALATATGHPELVDGPDAGDI